MKFIKKRNQWESSNVTFNPDAISATSYRWWEFVKVIKGEVVFNDYSYSVSTRKHQNKVRSLMQKLGIKIDRVVSFRKELNNISTLRELNKTQKLQNKRNAELAEEKRLARNAKARRKNEVKRLVESTLDGAAFRDYMFTSNYVENSVTLRVSRSDSNEKIVSDALEAVKMFVSSGAGSIRVVIK